ncbi:MAG: ATP-binding cassette domain-containing protein [Myxococcales bacterium]
MADRTPAADKPGARHASKPGARHASEPGARHEPDEPLIALRGVAKSYQRDQSQVAVLHGIDLSIPQGERVAIMGRSGSGKSTLLNILGCLDEPSSGTYLLGGADVSHLPDDELSRLRNRTFGFVFQAFHLLKGLTIVENVELPMEYGDVPAAEQRRRALELLELVGLGHRVGHRPSELLRWRAAAGGHRAGAGEQAPRAAGRRADRRARLQGTAAHHRAAPEDPRDARHDADHRHPRRQGGRRPGAPHHPPVGRKDRDLTVRRACLLQALLLVALVALGGASPAPDAGAPDEERDKDLFTGFLVPANATDLYAPQTSFRVRGWNSNWGTVKLMQLTADGAQVKQGDVIARFEFIGRDALQWIQDRIQRTEAEASQSRISSGQTLDTLLMDLRRKELAARMASLDVQREKALSKRQAELYKIQKKIADFEVYAVTSRIEGAKRSRDAENAYQDLNVKWVHDDLDRYRFYENAFQVRAPHDGVVRHAFNSQERRKLQKGDACSAGQKVVSLAKDAKLAARFFVPEHRLSEIVVGAEVTVTSNTSAEQLVAKVTKVDFFPQELGFLMEMPNLPNGQEKAFAVQAELRAVPEGLTAGTEIRVKARPR